MSVTFASQKQGDFLREQQEKVNERLLTVARADREVTVTALATRFKKSRDTIRELLKKHGLERLKPEGTFKEMQKAGGVAGGSFNRWRR